MYRSLILKDEIRACRFLQMILWPKKNEVNKMKVSSLLFSSLIAECLLFLINFSPISSFYKELRIVSQNLPNSVSSSQGIAHLPFQETLNINHLVFFCTCFVHIVLLFLFVILDYSHISQVSPILQKQQTFYTISNNCDNLCFPSFQLSTESIYLFPVSLSFQSSTLLLPSSFPYGLFL